MNYFLSHKYRFFSILAVLVAVFAVSMMTMTSCGSDSSSTSTTTTSTDSGTSTVAALSFPEDLALASPTAAKSASILVSAIKLLTKRTISAATVEADTDYATKTEAISTMISGDDVADCAFTLNLTTSTDGASCYGPQVAYTGHPDATGVGPSQPNGSFPPFDLGLWTENEGATTEACVAAQLNKKVEGIATLVDSAVFSLGSLMCVANVNSIAMPDAGASVDLKTELQTALDSNSVALTLTSATISRESDTAEGYKVYISSMAGATTNSDNQSLIFTIRLKHIPTAEDGSTYRGKLSFTVANATGQKPMQCGVVENTGTGRLDAVSVSYNKASATAMTLLLQSGEFCGNDADPYVSATNYTVDSTKKVSATETRGWGNNFNYALFSMNPEDATGTYQFAWQAGAADNATRVMNMSLSSDATDVTGCGYYGYGPDMAATAGVGDIAGIYCNWAGPSGYINSGHASTGNTTLRAAKSQRQCVSRAVSGGTAFTATSSNITYVPTVSCDYSGIGSFALDGTAVSATTNNLVNVSAIDITVPAAPADVDE